MMGRGEGWRDRSGRMWTVCGAVGLGLAAVVATTAPSAAQHGQWWKHRFERPPPRPATHEGPEAAGAYEVRTAHEVRAAYQSRGANPHQLSDLRPGQTPLRSQEMINALERAIERYQTIVTKGGWPEIPGSRPIRAGKPDERMPVLYRRLAISGEWKEPPQESFFGVDYSDGMETAVRRFQENNGLRVTGRVDRQTLRALNVPAIARLAQLRINLQRLRGLVAHPPDDRYVLVNAASFQLEAVENGRVDHHHRVIVGKADRQTPSIRAEIRALNFFPYWRVPLSVANRDLIPRLVHEPEYLQKEHIRVLDGSFNGPEIDASTIDWTNASKRIRFRQDPGPWNALGFVRIDMTNREGVYMHDTPMRHLFRQRWRAFSAGCVRVQDVFRLVEWIAKYEPGWSQPGRAQEILAAGQAVDVKLSRRIPVYFTYITAWAEPNGRIMFRSDIYKRDGVGDLLASLERDPDDEPPPRFTLTP